MKRGPGHPRGSVRRSDGRESISVSVETYDKIRALAEKAGMSISAFTEERINQFLNRKGAN